MNMSDVIEGVSFYVDHKTHFGPGGKSVLRAFLRGDYTDQEVAKALKMKDKTVSARRTELWRWGLVEPIGLRKMVRQRAKVWSLTPAGREQATTFGETYDPR